MGLSTDGEEIFEEVRVLTKQEEIAVIKARLREHTDPVEKLYGIYDLVTAYVALWDDDGFRAEIREELDRLDLNAKSAFNWLDKGWDPTDFYKVSCHNRLNDAMMILAKVENRAIVEGLMPVVEETVDSMEELLEMEILRGELEKLQVAHETEEDPDDG